MSAIANTARMGTRTCSKGMFNDLFGQWNAHVHSWCHTKENIRKIGCVSIPSSPSCFIEKSKKKQKQNKRGNKMLSVMQKADQEGESHLLPKWKNVDSKAAPMSHPHCLVSVPLALVFLFESAGASHRKSVIILRQSLLIDGSWRYEKLKIMCRLEQKTCFK